MSKEEKTVEGYVALAEKLAKDNGGMLPDSKWLRGGNYRDLLENVR